MEYAATSHAPVNDPHADHAHAAEDFHPHVTPLWIYIATWLALMALTAITVGVSYLNLGAANLAIALIVATTKATIVALFFMHLRWDLRFHSIIFTFSVIFLFIFIWFTMYDTETRGRADPIQSDRPLNSANPFSGSREKEKLEIENAAGAYERGKKIEVKSVPPPEQPPR
jgi:cytochrome c oxidase subunit IV